MIELFPDNTIEQRPVVKSCGGAAVMPVTSVFMQREEIILPSFQNKDCNSSHRKDNLEKKCMPSKTRHLAASSPDGVPVRKKKSTGRSAKYSKLERTTDRSREFKWLAIAMICCGMFFGMLISASILFYGEWKSSLHSENAQELLSDRNTMISDLTSHEEQYKMITIQDGDSLWSIAKEHMIPGYSSVEEMVQCISLYNHLEDSRIFAGQTLKIPYSYVTVSKGL